MKREPIIVTVTATEANRRFSALLREVAEGRAVTITSRGQPVANLYPPGFKVVQADPEDQARRAAAQEALQQLWRLADARDNPPERWKFNRDEIYDDDF
jgi:prevent-host-death family protein